LLYVVLVTRPTHPLGNLPAESTSFIGRRRELAQLRRKLSAARLVSLVGPGGVGKTRLAVRIGTDLARSFQDGAWLVELAEVHDGQLIANAALAALDLRDQAATEPLALLISHLRGKELLLVVDNCEHLLADAARFVAEVLRAAPGVRVLTTSREPLSGPGEHVVPVPPLDLPPTLATEPLSRLRQNEAVMLFVERAAAASGEFELTASNRATVIDLCRRLDGLPLAIELAAVRTRVLSVDQILDRLGDRFGLLTGGGLGALPRHKTLRTTIEWSHDLLGPAERTILRRLCVFAGRFILEDVEGVCMSDDAPASEALDLLISLVDKSLVVKEDASGLASYRLHETMREFSALKLSEAGEAAATELSCAEYYRSRCRRSAREARYGLVRWLAWIDLEIDNVREVLRRCLVNGDRARGNELAFSLGWYWMTRATSEGARWLDGFLAGAAEDMEINAPAHFMRGFLAVLQADATIALSQLEIAVADARPTGQTRLLSQALSLLAVARGMGGDLQAAGQALEEVRAISSHLDDPAAAVTFLQAQSLDGFFRGDLATVKTASSEGARRSREAGDLYSLEMMLLNLGLEALTAREASRAWPFLSEGFRIAQQIDDRVAQFMFLGGLGCRASAAAEHRLAAQLFGAAETMRAGAGAGVNGILGPLLIEARAASREALGAARFEADMTAGTGMGRAAAATLALGESTDTHTDHTRDTSADLLGRREADIAKLVADGLSNKQIGAQLFISDRTVESHVRSILNKLGFNSRAQIAGWFALPPL